ncbi:Outer membrane efflux protein [Pedobacter cryoconitis]|uniref:Outer membrane efflux protein n=1 Tax=Pedobacter cryoconitis TaxID=188932 RepID=A0A127VIE0_9SPHI|nr:TolC family protein [Pedobacter cryoconitis]AMQ01096.1 Outer membrane efflux protein [Pedobacter cryoconitis]
MYTSFIKASVLLTGWLLILGKPAIAQQQSRQLDDYISLAFGQNQGLKQQNFDLEKSLFALKEAKAMYLPTVSMLGSYTKSAGGRTIDVPVGDLVNPIYSALNQLTSSSKYPQIANQSFLLNPDNFYDVKLRTSLPLINAEIRYNKLIKQQLISSQQAAVNVYKRALVKDIKTAYYHYFQALQGVEAYRSALLLIDENIRVNTSLLKNGVRNGTALLRAQTEQEKTNAALINAQRNVDNASAYFNFLLNRPLKEAILIDSVGIANVLVGPDTTTGISGREELKQLSSLKEVNNLDYKLQRSNLIPKLSTFVDLGSQGMDFKVNDKTRYYLWGVNLQWDLFTGGKNKFRAAQAQSNIKANTAKIDETEQSFKLQLAQAHNNYRAAKAACTSAVAGLSFAGKYYRDQLKAYRAGQLLYLELIDAQDQLTSAKLRMADTQADLQITLAELERDQATYPLNN